MKKLLQLIRFLFIKRNVMEVYYIQGDGVLPRPLDREEELAALVALEDGDEKARSTLIEYNFRLVVYIAERCETNPTFMEDLISIGSIGLIKAANTFKWDKNIRLVAYASRYIESEVLIFLCKRGRRRVEVGFDELLNINYDGNELLFSDILGVGGDVVTKEFEKKENKRELLGAMSALKERERQISQMRYGIQHGELTQKDIAKRLDISQPYISRSKKHITAKLKVQMESSQQNNGSAAAADHEI